MFHAAFTSCVLLLTGACVRGQDVYAERAEQRTNQLGQTEPVSTRIATISRTDGQTLVELPVGSEQLIQDGTLMHVYASTERKVAKGMLQVMTILGHDRSYCRLIGGLYDRQNPLSVGDHVVEILDIASLDGAEAVEKQLNESRAAEESARDEDREAFANLRSHYQHNLEQLRSEHTAELKRRAAANDAELDALRRRHRQAIARLQAEHQVELTNLQITLAAESAKAIRQDRALRKKELERLTTGLAKAEADQEKLVARNHALKQRIEELLAADAKQQRTHATEIRAEVETREVLAAKLAAIRSRLSGADEGEDPVLTIDGKHRETILKRLERVVTERNELRETVTDLTGRIEKLQKAPEATDTDDGRLELLRRTVGELEEAVAELETSQRGLALLRLQSERAYYQLAQAVLRLPDVQPGVRRIQAEVRERLAASLPAPAAEGTP